MESPNKHPGVGPKSSPIAPGSTFKWVIVPIAVLLLLSGMGANKYFQIKNHVAPLADGAIPERIGCDDGCDLLNRYEGWQPYLVRVAEVARRDYSCKRVDYVSVSTESVLLDNPKFFVVCDGLNGETYTTQHFKKVVDIQYRKLNP